MSGPECEKCGEHCVDCRCQKESNPVGRPPITIDWDKVNEMLEAGSDGLEIAAAIGVNRDTLYDRTREKYHMSFSDYSARKHSKGIAEIRLAQHKKAVKGNVALLLFLGRVRLKQVEAQPEKVEPLPPHEDYLILKDENIRLRHQVKEANAS